MAVPLQLPVIQNWSCHNCGGCCRQHAVEVTAEERARIEQLDWTGDDDFLVGQKVVESFAGPPWNRRYRLGHQADGACVFLDEKGLCRIHGKFGESVKPLACRLYPYAFHPRGKRATVSLRFSCPSVIRNQGRAVAKQRADIDAMARDIVPSNLSTIPPPQVTAREALNWADTEQLVLALDDALQGPGRIATKVCRALTWIDLVNRSKFSAIAGERFREFLQLIRQAADAEVPNDPTADPPSSVAQMQFRLLVAQYARTDTFADMARGWRGRWQLFKAALQFTRGRGDAPPLQECFRPVPFDALEEPCRIPDKADDIFERYLHVKVHGMHFCGPAFYDRPITEGFQSLALVLPATMWIARWLARSDGRNAITTEDVVEALAIADHHHGYSPAFAKRGFRSRVRLLAKTNDLTKLVTWYAG